MTLNIGVTSVSSCPSGTAADPTTNICVPAADCSDTTTAYHDTWTPTQLGTTVCENGCAFVESYGAGQAAVCGEWAGNPVGVTTCDVIAKRTGAFCGEGSGASLGSTSTPSGGSACSQTTLLNGQVTQDCGTAASGIHCSFSGGKFSCSGNDSATATKCWTDSAGVINCVGTGVPSTTPVNSDTATQTNADGTSSKTTTQYLPGGGVKVTTTTYDAQGNPTGTTTNEQSGLGSDGNAAGGSADGTNLPGPDVPSATLTETQTQVPGLTLTNYIAPVAGCPADISVSVFGHAITVPYTGICNLLDYIYYAMVAGGMFFGARIFYGYIQGGRSAAS